MKKIRVLPYGYEYKDGIISNKEEEYIVVREIFDSYCKGNSLLKIAQFLNQRKIEYQPGTIGWNKARLKRILEDERYLGKRNFPQIVSEDLYQACNGIKQAKNKQENTDRKNEIYHLNVPIECPHCNSEMLRRGKTPDIPVSRWFCKMPNCTTVIRKDDAELIDEIHILLNKMINDPAIIQLNKNDNNEKRMAESLKNELSAILIRQGNEPDVLSKVLKCVSDKYKTIPTDFIQSQWLQNIFKDSEISDEFPLKLFHKTVYKVIFQTDSHIKLELKNGQFIQGLW